MDRYAKITDKKKREIVLLRGSGCAYGKCTFCDYCLDFCADEEANYALNAAVLDCVTGVFGELEVINSGSVFELDARTIQKFKRICAQKQIGTVHFESHWMYRKRIPKLRQEFAGVTVKMKLGLETFDRAFRESVLKKGIAASDPHEICEGFDEANFLFGISGQSEESMRRDIETGLRFFERICVNIMCPNGTSVRPDEQVIDLFVKHIYPQYASDPRVDILLHNTVFGVGD